jgi:hypothetical protein
MMVQISSHDGYQILTVVYEARGETWTFTFAPSFPLGAKMIATSFAQNKELDFGWNDAAAVGALIDSACELVAYRRFVA